MAKLLPQLDQIKWHDVDVHSLQINFSQRQFRIVLDCYDEEVDSCIRWEAIFHEIDLLKLDGAVRNDIEVYSLDVSRAGEFYHAQLLLLTQHGPSATINFQFKNVAVGLAPV